MLTLQPFTAAHALALTARAPATRRLPMAWIAPLYEAHGVGWSAFDGGQLFGCAGLLFVGEGQASAWLILDAGERPARRLFVGRTLKRWLPDVAAAHRLRRVETAVKAAEASHRRLLAWLGFEVEGRLRHYGPDDEDYLACAWFPQEEQPWP